MNIKKTVTVKMPKQAAATIFEALNKMSKPTEPTGLRAAVEAVEVALLNLRVLTDELRGKI
jgi:hypothetical protein